MITYFDTSALAKKYVKEVGSEEVLSLWRESTAISTSAVTYAEIMASLHRKRREATIADKLFERIINLFQRDWRSFHCVTVSEELHESINRLVAEYPLRGFDAIHLASALLVHERIPEGYVFACYDQQLAQAARKEGLSIFPGL